MSTTTATMRATDEPIEPVRKTRDVPLPPEQAFNLFTSRMSEWWPLLTHSIAADEAASVRFEERIGGRLIEITNDGQEHAWADVIAWDPPHRFVLAWHPRLEPAAASIVEVRFEPTEQGSLLHLEHRGWEEFGTEEGTAMRDAYGPGWDAVLTPYLEGVQDRTSSPA